MRSKLDIYKLEGIQFFKTVIVYNILQEFVHNVLKATLKILFLVSANYVILIVKLAKHHPLNVFPV